MCLNTDRGQPANLAEADSTGTPESPRPCLSAQKVLIEIAILKRSVSRAPSLNTIQEEIETSVPEPMEEPAFAFETPIAMFCKFYSLPPVVVETVDSVELEATTTAERRVHFGTISIRSYDVTVGDAVPPRGGVPLSLDWSFLQHASVDLEDYEAGRGKPGETLRLSRHQRWEILSQAGFDPKSLRRAQQLVWAAKVQRRLSNVWLPTKRAVRRLSSTA